MARNFLEAMKRNAISELDSALCDLLGIEAAESVNKDTGEISKFIRVEAEIPRGYGVFSRCQISVKIPDGILKIDPKELEDSEYSVIFDNFQISYIDSKGSVYFRADNYNVQRTDV